MTNLSHETPVHGPFQLCFSGPLKGSLEPCVEEMQCDFRPSTSPLTHSSPSQTSVPGVDGYANLNHKWFLLLLIFSLSLIGRGHLHSPAPFHVLCLFPCSLGSPALSGGGQTDRRPVLDLSPQSTCSSPSISRLTYISMNESTVIPTPERPKVQKDKLQRK